MYDAPSNPFLSNLQSLQRSYQSQRSSPQSPAYPQSSASSYSAPGKFSSSDGYSTSPSSRSSGFYSPLPAGGIYGSAKWNGGSATDVFMKRGTPVYAPFDGMLQSGIRDVPPGPMGVPPGFYLQGQGLTMRGIHIQPVATGRVRAGQVIGYISDDSMDMLGQYPGMPDGFQHADLAFSRSGQFSASGGDIDARQMLQQMGYQGTQIQGRTKGPPDAMGGMGGGMGMGMPGMGMGMGMGGPGGMPGMPGMPPMMGGGFGGGQGFGGSGFGGGGFGMPPMPQFGGMQGGPGGGNPFMMNPMMMQMMSRGGPGGPGGMQMPQFGGYPGGAAASGFGGFR